MSLEIETIPAGQALVTLTPVNLADVIRAPLFAAPEEEEEDEDDEDEDEDEEDEDDDEEEDEE